MPIFRGVGGSGDASTDAYASQVALSAQTATTKANEAEASATAAAASATAAAASEAGVDADATAAEAAKVAAEAAQAAAETAQTGAETAETNAAASAADAAATAASIGTLNSLSDVTVTTPSNGQVLKYNGSVWVNDTNAGGIANVVEDTTPQLGGTLDANGNTIDMGTNEITDTKVGQWDTAYGWGDHSTEGYLTGITGQSIESLSDVNTMTPTDGQLLTWDNANSRWDAADATGGDKIEEGNSSVEVVDAGTGYVAVTIDGTETARFVNGGDLKFNSGYGSVVTAFGCRAWVNFNGTGTVAIRDSGNVSSITDNGTGDYIVNFTTAMPDTNYSAVTTCERFTTYNFMVANAPNSIRLAGGVGLRTRDASGNAQDADSVYVAIFR